MLQKGNVFGESFPNEVKQQIQLREYLYGQGFESYTSYDTLQTAKRTEELQYLNANSSWLRLVSSVDVTNDSRFKGTAIQNLTIADNSLAKQYVLFGGILDTDSKGLRGGLDIAGENTLGDQTSYNYPINPKGDAYGVGGLESGFKPMPGITSATVEHLNNGTLRKAVIQIKAFNRAQFEILDALYLRLGYSMLLEWGHTIIAKGTPGTVNYERDPDKYTLQSEFLETPQSRNYEDFLNLIRERRLTSQGNYDGFIGRITNYTWEFAKDGSYDITLYAISTGDVIESLNMNSITTKPDQPIPINSSSIYYTAAKAIYPYKDKHDLGHFLSSVTEYLADKGVQIVQGTIERGVVSPMTDMTYFPGPSTNINAYSCKFSNGSQGEFIQIYVRLGYLLEFLEKKKILVGEKGNPMVRIDYDVKSNIIPLNLYTAPMDPSKCIFVLKNHEIIDTIPTYKTVSEQQTIYEKEYIEESAFDGLFGNPTFAEKIVGAQKEIFTPTDGTFSEERYYRRIPIGVKTVTRQVKISEQKISSTAIFYDSLEPTQNFPDAGFVDEDLAKKGVRAGRLMNVFFNAEYLLNSFDSLVEDETGKVSMYKFLQKLCDGFVTSTGNYNKLSVFIDEDTNTVKIIDKNTFPDKKTVIEYAGGSTDYATFNIYGFNPVLKDDQTNKTLIDHYKGTFVKNFNIRTELTKDTSAMIAISAAAGNQNILGEDSTAFSKWNDGLTDRVMKYFNSDARTPDDIQKVINEANKNFGNFILTQASGKYKSDGTYDGPRRPAWNAANSSTYTNAAKTLMKYYANQLALQQGTQNPGTGFLPLKVSLTMKGLSGMKILQEFKILSDFLPSNYPESLRFLVTNIKHQLNNNEWETIIETISAPESYIVEPETSRRDVETINKAARNTTVKLNKHADLSGIPCGLIKQSTTSPADLVSAVVNYIEGGYWNPNPEFKHPTIKGDVSGETMFGEDRKTGVSTGEAGQIYTKFWALVDKFRGNDKWKWLYKLQDRPQDQKQLIELLGKRRGLAYGEYSKVFTPQVKQLVESDGRLLFHFYYATWNGPAFFKGWAKLANQEYAKGVVTADAMLKVMMDDRLAGALRAYPLGAPTRYKKIVKKQGSFNGISLIAQGGAKVAQLTGYRCAP